MFLYRAICSPGSSPLARGLRCRQPGQHDRRRIIPARAGFTSVLPVFGSCWRDHPRSRGVYLSPAFSVQSFSGSSPLARGLRVDALVDFLLAGIIPARAGFTWTLASSSRQEPDHPRSRGVYVCLRCFLRQWPGSSPLARGLRRRGRRGHLGQGIIPARAGFTPVREPSVEAHPDHPRSRGVYTPAK